MQDKAAQHSKEHDAVVLKMAETIRSKVEEMMASEAIQQRVQRRLKEERAALEDKVLHMLKHLLSCCVITRTFCHALCVQATLSCPLCKGHDKIAEQHA